MSKGDGLHNLRVAREKAVEHLSDDGRVTITSSVGQCFCDDEDTLSVLESHPQIAARCEGNESHSYYIRIEDGMAHITRYNSETKTYSTTSDYVHSVVDHYDIELVCHEPLTCAFSGVDDE